jgi:AraC-like DNA-binding protein
MITDFYIVPHVHLKPFVNTYILSTSSGNHEIFVNQWPASHETSLVFYLADKPAHRAVYKEATLSQKDYCLVGLQTKPLGFVCFTGNYQTFIIQFKANGFTKLFGLPAQDLTDKIVATTDVFGPKASDLYNHLLTTKEIHQMALFADNFLLSFLKSNKYNFPGEDGITAAARAFCTSKPVLTVAQYAQQANMSVRNFERRFTEQVGIAPKLYSKLFRFNQALSIKLLQPEKNWTTIAYECGYYDQMHFIKEFKQLANITPTQFTLNQLQSVEFPREVARR